MEHIKSLQLQQGECMVSYDIKTLFTLVPVDHAISIVKNKLLQDPLLSHRTSMYIQDIITLLEFCLKNQNNSHQLLQHINSIDPNIQFTMENPKDDGPIPFLDTLVSLGPNNTLITSIYRKLIHTN